MRDIEVLDNLIVGRVEPHIYAFKTNTIPNYLKVGDTYRPVSVRLNEWKKHYPELTKEYDGEAKINDETYFRDYSVHQFLEQELGKERLAKETIPEEIYYSNEFFKNASPEEVEQAIIDINKDFEEHNNKYQFYSVRTHLPSTQRYASTGFWKIRPNQDKTITAFKTAVENGRKNLLMYAVMRFGKSFTSMCCADSINAKLVVIVSAKADVADEWKKTVESPDNYDYDFFTSSDLSRNYDIINNTLDNPTNPRKVVVFLTLQDLQGENIKEKHEQIFGRKIDLLIVDETHYGARAEKYGAVLKDVSEKLSDEEKTTIDDYDERIKYLNTNITLHLSGTPYRILMGSEFEKEDIIAFYQFTDIVEDQKLWDEEHILDDKYKEWENPYYGFPQMIRFAFNPSLSAQRKLEELRSDGNTYAFSALFKPASIRKKEDGSHKKFVNEAEILDLLEVIDGSKEDENLLGFLNYEKIKNGKMCRHIVCVLPYCASCDALEELIKSNADKFINLNQYEIINISGVDNQGAYKKPRDIKAKIKQCEEEGKKTITLTVNRMLTGSTVEQWDTMLYFKDTSSPQEYDQAIFRLQNQYVTTYVSDDGEEIKFNKKPQTLLVDFDPLRMFVMQEMKAQIYNVNTDESGNSKLKERLEKEINISPIIVINRGRIHQVEPIEILREISQYSKSRGVAEEVVEIPVDMKLMDIDEIRQVIELENELGSKSGFTTKSTKGDGDDFDFSASDNNGDSNNDEPNSDEGDTNETEDQNQNNTDANNANNANNEPHKDVVKQFRSYYARILFFAFLTKSRVISLKNIVDVLDEPENARIADNLSLNKTVLEAINSNSDNFILSKLDYKIQNLNDLSQDTSVSPVERAAVSVQKFGKLGESEVITPKKVCEDMVALLPDEALISAVENGHKILDIAGKAGEFALALVERYNEMGYDIESIKDLIYTIPTSGITYEFTRRIYEILGLNVNNIAGKITAYSIIGIKDEHGNINFNRIEEILTQEKSFSEIKIDEESALGEGDKVIFEAVIGNPPYQISDGGAQASARPIYHSFVGVAKVLSPSYLTMLMPTRWYAGGKGLDEFRSEMLNDETIEELHDFLHPEDIFPDTNNRGGICYLLWNKHYNNSQHPVRVITHTENGINVAERSLKYKDLDLFIRNSQAIDILEKVSVKTGENTLSKYISAAKAFGFRTFFIKDSRFRPTEDGLEDPVLCYGRAGRVGYVENTEIQNHRDWIDKWKVYIPESNNIGTELQDDNQNSFVGAPHTICTETFLVVGAELDLNEKSATNLSIYLRTKFSRFLLSLVKISQHGTSKTYRFVPLQTFSEDSDIDWSASIEEIDKQLYKKYNLTDQEIECIENTIKEMS